MLANPAFRSKPNARIGSTKTKTGCLTCKHARVKCDEDKPQCKRCARLKVQCGYRDRFLLIRASQRFSPVDSKGNPRDVSPTFQLPALVGDGTERKLFDFYRCEVALKLGGFLDRDFWYTTILRLAHSEQVIFHSIIAIAAAFKRLRYLADEDADVPADLAFKYYQRALKEANRRTQQEDCELVTMLTCTIFLCMEFLQGNKLQAMALFRHGHGLLQSFVDRRQLAQPGRISQLGESDRTFYAVFERLTLMSKMFGLDAKLTSFPGENLRNDTLLGMKFSSLEEARDSLVRRMVIGREFMKTICDQTRTAGFVHYLIEDNRREYKRLITQQEQWYYLFQDLCQRLPPGNASDAAMTAILTVFHFVAIIWLNCPLAGSQMSFDAYHQHFQAIIAQVRTVISSCSGDSKSDGIYTFEMGVLPAMYFTATKCRHFETRRQALELIRKGPKREGPWNRDELAVVAEEAIRLECAQLRNSDEWPSETDRIVKIKISQDDDGDSIKTDFIFENHIVMKTWAGGDTEHGVGWFPHA